jgi:ketosteroid isomerase-like protein
MKEDTEEEVMKIKRLIHQAFNIGKSKDLASIRVIHDERLTKFSDTPPYHMMGYEEACLHEEMFFANVSDYDFSIEDLRVDLLCKRDDEGIALATFILEHKGIVVDDYSFTGQTIRDKVRCTLVLKKSKDKWYILHEHLSKCIM